MKLLITGACGFVGSVLARTWAAAGHEVIGLDNLSRPGSEQNARQLRDQGVRLIRGDLRSSSDLATLPPTNAVIDAAANPSVLAGTAGHGSPRQLVEHNLQGTTHLLEYCREHGCALVMLSTSRVYHIPALLQIPIKTENQRFVLDHSADLPAGLNAAGITEIFPAGAPCSLYGATKLASETMALEYGAAFGFPIWINRCGVLAGAGQFGRADQGIFSFWIHAWRSGAPLRYIGFGGSGYQVRDCLHPTDLIPVIDRQLAEPVTTITNPLDRIFNLAGGPESTMSLAELSDWCAQRFDLPRDIPADLTPRPFDLPWVTLSTERAQARWGWQPQRPQQAILEEIAEHAERHPDWLQRST